MNTESMAWTEVAAETVIRDAVSVVAATLLPSAVV